MATLHHTARRGGQKRIAPAPRACGRQYAGRAAEPFQSGNEPPAVCRILACSPRKGGNTDEAARLFAESVAAASGGTVDILYLRDFHVLPCIDCNACGAFAAAMAGRGNAFAPSLARLASGPPYAEDAPDRAERTARRGRAARPYGCPLARKDDSAALLALLAETPELCLVSPVYFYHLPAQLKALIDRTQPFWRFAEAGLNPYAGLARRRCSVILAGARPGGERLFEGSLLTLRYAFRGLHADIAAPLTLYGLDGPDDIRAEAAAPLRERIRAYGREIGGVRAGQNGA